MRIDNLQKSFGSKVLFADATFHFPAGERIALVGANGAGKTTLLNIICGLESADDGRIVLASGTTLGYLPQEPNASPATSVKEECMAGSTKLTALRDTMEQALATMNATNDAYAIGAYEKAEAAFRLEGGYSLESRATGILAGLGFQQSELVKDPRSLSGGWRMRLELARLFLRQPDFLILDEPTNHLDLPSLVWVESYLRSFAGTVLFVSHDRSLLNRLATMTLHLSGGQLTPYRGNFDAFLTAREERLMQQQAERDQLRRRREQMEHFVERFGAKATKAAQAQSRVKMIARIRELEDTLPTEGDEASVHFSIPAPGKTPRIVFKITRGAIGYNAPLAVDIDLEVEKGSKIAIIGANGIGKSTLLRTIAGRLQPLDGEFALGEGVTRGYFAQEQTETLRGDASVLENLIAYGNIGEKDARSLLGAFLFTGDAVFKKVKVLSGGEKSRVGLACVLAQKSGLLLLDEPTNHLDMASVETLAAGLADYEGTVIFVSHDREFIDNVCTHVFAMLPDGRSMLFPGKLADYQRLAEIAGFPNVLKVDEAKKGDASTSNKVSDSSNQYEQIKELKRNRQKLESQLAKLDSQIVELRTKIQQLESAMSSESSDFAKAAELHKEQQGLQEKLEGLELDWLQTAESLEDTVTKLSAQGRT
ncbi:MAG: ABC-F family ATP-binding cassette domain-containing protein [Deltaproteobacteria bacterium]|nr:ABC-F family ATP-binding cassette domain-containing protein [Deltaproteobacteria bacterium]